MARIAPAGDFPNLSSQKAQLDETLFGGFYAYANVSNGGVLKAPLNFFFFWQKLSIEHEHLDKLDHKQNSARGSGKIKWMLQVSVGGLGSFCRCKYNSSVNVDHKLYIL